jgi:O-antigen/teichoic acid export membrane protein
LIMGYLISFLFIFKYLKKYPFEIVINKENLKKYFFFAYPIIFSSIFSWGISYSDRYFIDYYMELKDVAFYAILAQVASFGQVIGQVYNLYVAPKVLKLYEQDKVKALKYLSRALKILFSIFIGLTFLAYLLPLVVYEIILEPSVLQNNYNFYVFMFLVVGIFITILQTAYAMYLSLHKKLHILAYIYLIAFILNLCGNFYIKDFGILAASISTLIAYFIILSLQFLYVRKYLYAY